MMVTFVSQCEKKALSRTRKVLDAFADRIGDNTWQTVITQEGLLSAKKALRRTASKNTAVSCHWLRSRSRSELIWIVGQKLKFNENGLVPVNSTQKEVPMDIITDKPVKGVVYANTHLQRLDHHLFAVGYVAKHLLAQFFPEESNLLSAAFTAGCLHDLGKIDPAFQGWVTKGKNKSYLAEDGQHIDEAKFSFEKHPRHNEISLVLYALLDDSSFKVINGETKKRIKHAIYWHHAKPFRPKGGFETLGEIYHSLDKNLSRDKNLTGDAWNEVVEKTIGLIEQVAKIDAKYHDKPSSDFDQQFVKLADRDALFPVEDSRVPKYKEYGSQNNHLEDYQKEIRSNALNNIVRTCVITADRWVSSVTASELADLIAQRELDALIAEKTELSGLSHESNLESDIDQCLSNFSNDERGTKQSEVATKLADNTKSVGVLAGAAGCGKTKIALEWAKLRAAKQIFWICPRVQICQGLFADLTKEPYLPDATIEILTGEFKYTNKSPTDEGNYFTGDIVITTIDQLLNTVISHTKADQFLHFLDAHVVFDEYHEYINMPAFNLLFAELVEAKKMLSKGSNTLLVSATPHYSYLEEILNIDKEYDVAEMPSFNPCKYKFNFVQYDETAEDGNNPLYQQQPENTFVISNTAITTQKSFIKNQSSENAILFHSKFKKSDKKKIFDKVFESFGKGGTRLYDVLRSGPIVQASLNVSCEKMVSEVCHAENHLQRLGRLDRFGQNTQDVNEYTVAVPDTIHSGKKIGRLAGFLNRSNVLDSCLAWYNHLLEVTDHGNKELTLPEIYQLYQDFYKDEASINAIKQDLLKAMKKSAELISDKVSEPKVVVKPKKANQGRAKISKNSLRGDSRFVQMAVCNLDHSGNTEVTNKYAYELSSMEKDELDSLTESLDYIKNSGLLDYAAQKHGRVDPLSPIKGIPANKMEVRKSVLESYARDPEYPIYLSYTPDELDQKLGERVAHEHAVYYLVCEKQAIIGTISIKHITNQED